MTAKPSMQKTSRLSYLFLQCNCKMNLSIECGKQFFNVVSAHVHKTRNLGAMR